MIGDVNGKPSGLCHYPEDVSVQMGATVVEAVYL